MSDSTASPIPELPAGRTVLVVDDGALVRRLAYRLLTESGYRVFEAGDASEALEVLALAAGRIELALVDVVLPDVNGVDLARMIRASAPAVSVVFMSAFPAEVLVAAGLRDPAVQFLAKPFTRGELLRSVERALEVGSGQGDGSPSPRAGERRGA